MSLSASTTDTSLNWPIRDHGASPPVPQGRFAFAYNGGEFVPFTFVPAHTTLVAGDTVLQNPLSHEYKGYAVTVSEYRPLVPTTVFELQC